MFTIAHPKTWLRSAALSLDEYADLLASFTFNGVTYQPGPVQTFAPNKQQEISDNFVGYVQGAYKSNGIVFACMLVRQLLFSEARFQFTQMNSGRRGKLFGTTDLAPLENPWPGGTTGDLLTRVIQDADLAGNFYGTRNGNRIKRLRPDWVSIILGSESDSLDDAELIGYAYWPGGKQAGKEPITLLPEQVAHFAPVPDPEANYRGMSWLTPIVTEILGDKAASSHKLKFFENGATSNLVITRDQMLKKEAFELWVDAFRAKHEGIANAYKTIFLDGGSDAKVVGANFQQMEFKVTQGAGETRIAAAAGVPPVIVGLSEGLAAATYSNYELAVRRFVDLTMRPLWRNLAGSMATLVNVPPGSELWFDDRDVPALHENAKNAADIDQVRALTIHSLITAGFEPDAVVATINPEWTSLQHTGMLSVQLTPIGKVGEGKGSLVGGQPEPAKEEPVSANGGSAEA